MGLQVLQKGEVLHTANLDKVGTIDILLKGEVRMSGEFYSVTAKAGALLGLAELPGMPYKFTYQASADSQVMSYPYTTSDDIVKVITGNENIAPILAAESIRLVCEVLSERDAAFAKAKETHDKILSDYNDYPVICASVGEYPQTYDSVKYMLPPAFTDVTAPWEAGYFRALNANAEELRKNTYSLSPEIAVGMIFGTVKFYTAASDSVKSSMEYENQIRSSTADFNTAFQMMKSRSVEKDRQNALGDENAEIPAIENALETILSYAGADQQVTEEFRKGILEFREKDDRYASTDEERVFRRNLGKLFYDIYFAACLKSFAQPEGIPSEVRMMFMFGFIDEVLAGEAHTSMLYSILRSYKPDPKGKVVTAYEWLHKIYNLEVVPSRNEFDQDYPTWLREQKMQGEITEDKMKQMQDDPESRFWFEAKNLFTIGGRVTFGHAASFVPFFDRLNVTRPLEKAYVNTEIVDDVFNKIRGVDFGLFARQRAYFNPVLGNTQFFLDEVIMPYVILTPVIGSRGNLWQEIDGKDRGTPARMLISIFHTENLDNLLLQMCGEFRWEMCKTEHGVHWNDVSDPSLTALYCDYLQFYKKNRSLNETHKEKIKTMLKKSNNNYKTVFMADYITYVNFEANESPRLNKVAREILFQFCPFPKEMREKMADNPQYRELIKKHETSMANKARPLAGTISKLQKDGIEVPAELMEQYKFLKG